MLQDMADAGSQVSALKAASRVPHEAPERGHGGRVILPHQHDHAVGQFGFGYTLTKCRSRHVSHFHAGVHDGPRDGV